MLLVSPPAKDKEGALILEPELVVYKDQVPPFIKGHQDIVGIVLPNRAALDKGWIVHHLGDIAKSVEKGSCKGEVPQVFVEVIVVIPLLLPLLIMGEGGGVWDRGHPP